LQTPSPSHSGEGYHGRTSNRLKPPEPSRDWNGKYDYIKTLIDPNGYSYEMNDTHQWDRQNQRYIFLKDIQGTVHATRLLCSYEYTYGFSAGPRNNDSKTRESLKVNVLYGSVSGISDYYFLSPQTWQENLKPVLQPVDLDTYSQHGKWMWVL